MKLVAWIFGRVLYILFLLMTLPAAIGIGIAAAIGETYSLHKARMTA